MRSRGILLIAAGHPYYGELAANLAATIKVADKNTVIAVAKTDEALQGLSKAKLGLFDELITIPPEAYTTDGRTEWIKTKTYVYDLSPFDSTLFLDVDMAYVSDRSATDLIARLDELGVPWTMQNTGKSKYSIWADFEEIKKVYGEDCVQWAYHSEFIYFRKCKESEEYWSAVKDKYVNPGLDTARVFGGARLADELAYELASIATGQYPHKEKFIPVFWYARDKKEKGLHPYQIKAKYCAMSVGGNTTPVFIKNNYDIVVRAAFKKLGIPYPFKFKDKLYYIPERKLI